MTQETTQPAHPSHSLSRFSLYLRAFRAAWSYGKQNPRWLWLSGAVILVLIFPFELGWTNRWRYPDAPESFQPLVPLAAGIICWRRRAWLRHVMRSGSRPAGDIWLIVAACALIIVSHFTRMLTMAMLAIPLLAAGVVLHAFGRQVLRACLAPILFLLLMLPMPSDLLNHATTTLQLRSTQAAGAILTNLGRHSTVEGNIIHLRHYDILVTQACSGIGILLPLTALVVWYLMLMRSNRVQKALLFFSAFPLAIVLNIFRLAATGLVGSFSPRLGAFLHDANSWLFTALAFYGMLWIGRIYGIRRVWDPAAQLSEFCW